MNNLEPIPGTGADKSKKDKRTIQHKDIVDMGVPLVKGGYDYFPQDIEHQHSVGICTAISLIQNREKANGKKYSPDFQYLLQKKFYDKAWFEGSSVLVALAVGKHYGFLPLTSFTDLNGKYYATEQDRFLPYSQYIVKLQAIPDSEVQRLVSLCIDNIAGYAQVDAKDPQAIAKAIIDSEAGVICRYGCQQNWWTPSWAPKDIDPLRYATETSGHAIVMKSFDYTTTPMQMLSNTWGILWDIQGNAHINFSNYKPTEVWTILKENPMFQFQNDMKLGSRLSPDVKELQKRLQVIQTGYFWVLTRNAVIAYQKSKGLVPDGIVGKNTIQSLNS